MAKALRNYANTPIPQNRPENSDQIQNNASGYVYEASDKSRLERFLILGVDGGTYYVSETDLTKQNVDFLISYIKKNEKEVLDTTVQISHDGRAYRNDAAVFVLALMLNHAKDKQAVVAAVPSVCRIATHAYQLAEFISNLGGWGTSKRAAIVSWFKSKTPDQLAYQAVKYRQRSGWTLRDLMRKAHPKDIDQNVGNFILGKPYDFAGDIIAGFNWMKDTNSVESVIWVLNRYPNLPWETIPTQFLNDPTIWKTLLANGQLKGQAAIRQITRMAKLGMFDDMGFARQFAALITNEEMIKATRLHPMQYLNAYVVYGTGGVDGQVSWTRSGIIQDALDDGFGLSFGNIEPSNKRIMISVDVSGSMSWYAAGNSKISCAQAAGALALITARVESNYIINGFQTNLVDLGISARDSIGGAMRKVQKANFGGTDAAKPVLHAYDNSLKVDSFIVITDNETWAGHMHPSTALKRYRQKSGIPARMVVMGMASNNFSIADPNDPLMLDVVGFDTNTPKVVSDFSAGRI